MPQYVATPQKPISPQDILTAKKRNLIAKGTTLSGSTSATLTVVGSTVRQWNKSASDAIARTAANATRIPDTLPCCNA
jgi:hypothetical protein